MKSIFENVIARGEFDLKGLLEKIDTYHIEGKMTDAERDALYAQARERARPNYDAGDEIERLWIAIRALKDELDAHKAGEVTPEPEPEQPGETEEWPEYVQPQGAHDAYRVGDWVTFNGQRYVCKLDGTVWSPSVYPAAWDVVEASDAAQEETT